MKVGHIHLITESEQVIDEDVNCNEDEYFRSSKHPARRIMERINEVIAKQESAGDPVAVISSAKYSAVTGDDGYTGTF